MQFNNYSKMATYEQLIEVAKALNSGLYHQAKGYLRTEIINPENKFFGYCCLGVAKEVCKIEEVFWSNERDNTYLMLQVEDKPSEAIFLPLSVQKFLAKLNDSGFEFTAIADIFYAMAQMLKSGEDWIEINEKFNVAYNLLSEK